MQTAARVFYLAVFALLGNAHAEISSKHATKAKDANPDVCAFEPGAIVSDACASYSTLDNINAELFPFVRNVTQNTDFFSYYRLNLNHKTCPFWSDDSAMCKYETCAVTLLDKEEDIPLPWRSEELSKIQGPKAQHPGRRQQAERPAQRPLVGELGKDVGESCVVEYDDECDERDYCVPEDESATAKGDYVSLVENPERFTGYTGASTHQVWSAIYRENCFLKHTNEEMPMSSFGQSSPFGNPLQAQAALDLRNVMKGRGAQQGFQQAAAEGNNPHLLDGLEFEDSCVEKRAFHRVISGMHSSISTHLCYEFLNRTTGEWGPNLACYKQRLHTHPDRLSNLYFNYALLLRAVGKLKNQLTGYSFCSADPSQDADTKRSVLALVNTIPDAGKSAFDESVMFKGPDALGLKEDFKNRFRNVSRIMDCVGCDRCRLWGKVQTNGYGTALKVLFEFDEKNPENNPYLKRTELVALMNTFNRVSHSLKGVQEFEAMIYEESHRGSSKPQANAAAAQTSSVVDPLNGKLKPTPIPYMRKVVEDEDDYVGPPRRSNREGMTASEEIWDEFFLVWRMFAWVLRSWMQLPGKLTKIFIMECGRLWDYWLGLPMRPRSWELKLPTRDEI